MEILLVVLFSKGQQRLRVEKEQSVPRSFYGSLISQAALMRHPEK